MKKLMKVKKNKNYKKCCKYDDYIPFTGKHMIFFTEEENINNRIIQFEKDKDKIVFLANDYKNLDIEKY